MPFTHDADKAEADNRNARRRNKINLIILCCLLAILLALFVYVGITMPGVVR